MESAGTVNAADDADGWSAWPAPAKLNLFLHIVGRRADDYHLLQTVFQLLDWGDTVHLRVRADGQIVRVAGNESVPADADLMVRAARLLQAQTGCTKGCEIAIDKVIPMGGGFGGGSSDAATVLVALDHLWGTQLGEERLAALGLRLGADVPVFVRGRNAWAEGVGDILTPIELPPRWYLLVDPGVPVPTAELFKAPELTRDSPRRTIHDVFSASWGNAFEPVLRAREPQIAAALDALAAFGHARVTGSGAGCFVGFDSLVQAQAAQAALGRRWQTWVVAGAAHSPLRERVESWR
ncbi:MAG: 4-(cytidine 5'-diphospho)-2-C-methyl-D-erythritol kinase [Proteobacteria bacterium]|nr:4-(cytidine 5'-diphospho)-2-C-methyl-D-erythritol kinase [Pseudomonadota bacterium]